VTVNLIPPATLYSDRRNNIDFRVAKIIRYGRTRTLVGVDITTSRTQTWRPDSPDVLADEHAWLTPTSIQPARYARVSAQIDF